MLARVEAGEWPQTDFTAMMDKALTRNEDRALFGLAVIAGNDQKMEPGTNESVPAASA